ncbi:VOC family protein [Sphingomonas japonica]|uniref:Catechol 2,3-dioxygenase-like lactoylglutathione lyase family enzyme n=1 Tax=Sphingomonas japonica TaxID=511662 RepID=A0ABX0TZJ8_9SPHN|nr:VOC family protein [Sphingomonas japonica]NIJ23744.1 catechol 2,3-dioxygenase-like lactoylglutathione lyase family enzyme [Sphingomonas japonica]
MLTDRNSSAIVAVKDVDRARTFYRDTLGLAIVADTEGVLTLRTGTTFLNVYRSDEAGTNCANAVVWDCGEAFDAIVAELKSRGVAFEDYGTMDGMKFDGDAYRTDGFAAAWFKDPDGNILHINSGM